MPPTYDLLFKNAHVIDPANQIDAPLDLAVRQGLVAQVSPEIPTSEANQVVDLTGFYLTPGLLDIHTHVYQYRSLPGSGGLDSVNADAHLFATGVTTTVDAGTIGWRNFADFKTFTVDRSKVRILAFLNIAANGMADNISEQTMADMQPGVAASLAQAYPELIVGIKTAHYWTQNPWDDDHLPWASVERAIEAGELCGKPVMVDFWPRPPERSYPDLLLKKLRPGDIHTHVFAQQFPIVGKDGHTNQFMFAARERGILFDLGHGAGSFWFRNAVPAYRDGFPPDTFSTDLHMGSVNGPALSMQNAMSKYLSLGMPLQEVIWRATQRPAELIGRPEFGTLKVGSPADIAAFKLHEGSFSFIDCGRARLSGRLKLECQLTLRDGQVVFDPTGLTMPEWTSAPAPYWVNPTEK